MTVAFPMRRCHRAAAGDWILWHAAAGGIGTIAIQALKTPGATVIGTARAAGKCRLALSLGANYTIHYRSGDWVQQVKELTRGRGAHVVHDGVGRDMRVPSLDCLDPRGHVVSSGNAFGPVPPIVPLALMSKASIRFTRPRLVHDIATRAHLEQSAPAQFDMIGRGAIRYLSQSRYYHGRVDSLTLTIAVGTPYRNRSIRLKAGASCVLLAPSLRRSPALRISQRGGSVL